MTRPCPFCRQNIIGAVTQNRTLIEFEAEPTDQGSYTLHYTGGRPLAVFHHAGQLCLPDVPSAPRYSIHACNGDS